MEETYSGWKEVHRNINKARSIWKRLGKMLIWEGADSRVSYLFYRAVVQVVLLFGSESWALSEAMIGVVEVTHVGFLRQITGNQARRQVDGT